MRNRGYSLGMVNGEMVFASARDIGNFGAGYIAGRNGTPWGASRVAFDALQSLQDGRMTTEGFPSQAAQRVGWEFGHKAFVSSPDMGGGLKRAAGNANSLINVAKNIIKKIFR